MPDFGLEAAIRAAVKKGAKGAKVLRPAEKEIIDAAAKKAEADAAAAAVAPPEAPGAAPAASPEVATAPPAAAKPAEVKPQTKPKPAQAAAGEPVVKPAEPPRPNPTAAEIPVERTPDPVEPLTPPELTQVHVDAFRMSRAQLGDFVLDETHQPNFDTITTTDDIKATIADVAQRNMGKIDEARRGTIANEQLKGLAGELNLSQDVVRQVMERETGGVLNPETILAARQVLNSSAERLKSFADKIAAGQATDIEKLQFARQLQFHNEYQAQFMGARAETGRALNAFKIPVGSDATQVARIQEIIAASGGDVERIARAIRMTDSVSGVTEIARGGLFRRSGQAAMSLINRNFVNGILSSPATHLVNTSGNALFQTMNAAELAVAARLGRFLPGVEHVQVGEAAATLHGTLNAVSDAYRLAGRALRFGETLDNTLKFEASGAKGTLSTLPELDTPFFGRIVHGLDVFIGLPTRALGAEDEFFKMLAYRADLERQALLHVQEQIGSGALKIEEAEVAAREFIENAPEEAQKAAEDWANEATFQNPLGPFAGALQTALRKAPVLTMIAPFIRTPVNIFKESAARSPMAVFSARFWKDVNAGGRARDLALTRFAMGSATAALVAKWWSDGSVTGAGPQQPEARMLWMSDGKRPYSFRVQDPITKEFVWHSYARLEPFASVIGSTADACEILSYVSEDVDTLTDEETQAYQAAGAIVAGVMNNTGNKTFMKGIADFVELMNNPQQAIKGYSNQMLASQIPYSSLLRFVRNTQDPYLREAWTLLDKVKDNTPGYSKDLPLRLDLYGDPREKNHSTLLGAMSPIPESGEKFDDVTRELMDVMKETRIVPVTMPGKRVEGMRLNASEYADLVRLSRAEPTFGPRNFHDQLDTLMMTPVYQTATPMLRAEMLKKVQSSADAIGVAKLEKENPDFAERIADWRMTKARLKFNK